MAASFFLLGTEDQIVLILADHRLVGRNRQHAQLVGAHEFGGFGLCGTGHACQLVVHAEVVLQGDGGEGLVFGLDLHAFLGFDGLVQTLVVTAARQDTSGVLVDDEHFAAGHDVVAVAQEQLLGLDGVVQIADQCGVVRFVQVVDAEIVLDLGDARIKDADDLLLLVDLIVLVTVELQNQARELAVPAGRRPSAGPEMINGVRASSIRMSRPHRRWRSGGHAARDRTSPTPCCRAGNQNRIRCWCRR